MEMIAYTILQLLGPNPLEDIWSSLKLTQGISMQEMNVLFYQEKKTFLTNTEPRYSQILGFIKEIYKLGFKDEPNYAVLRGYIYDLYKGVRID